MARYSISGMSCASCASSIEKEVKSIKGIKSVTVSLLTNSMNVEGDVKEEEIISRVKKLGYGIEEKGEKTESKKELPSRYSLKKLILSIVLLLLLMYLAMGHMFFSLIPIFQNNLLLSAILQMLLALTIIALNKHFFVSGFSSLIKLHPNMDTLVSMGSGISFIWSLFLLFKMTTIEDSAELHSLYMNLYFESSAMILVLITVGKMLEERSKGKTTNALKSLISLRPTEATILRGDIEEKVNISRLQVGDIVLIRPGEVITADGVVIEGESAVDESSLTGESIAVDKTLNSHVSEGTINQTGVLKCRVERVGQETTMSRIIKTIEEVTESKAPLEKITDKVSLIFVPSVIAISLIVFISWLIIGKGLSFSLLRAISVLVISCPCALGLATPLAIMVGTGVGAKNGILFKDSETIENTGKIKIVAFDKTGTLTSGEPKVVEIYGDETLLKKAASVENNSEHPLSKAIINKAKEERIALYPSSSFSSFTGLGVKALVNGKTLYGGNYNFIKDKAQIDKEYLDKEKEMAERGITPLYFIEDGVVLGIIGIRDTLRKEAILAANNLRKMGRKVVILTGDKKETALAVSKELGDTEVYSSLLPEEKAIVINKLKKKGRVMMVGDGINDAPSLASADIAVSLSHASFVATDSANVVLMKDNLLDIPALINLSEKTFLNIKENLFWAFFYNILLIPLASGCFTSLLGWTLSPMIASAAMSLSSLCVCFNVLRLNRVNIYKIKERKMKEEERTTLILHVEGMMCEHCEKRVEIALLSINGVESAIASEKDKRVQVILSRRVKSEKLIKAIAKEGYSASLREKEDGI